jgi:hypothetical protein
LGFFFFLRMAVAVSFSCFCQSLTNKAGLDYLALFSAGRVTEHVSYKARL